MNLSTRPTGCRKPHEDYHRSAPGLVSVAVVVLMGLAAGIVGQTMADDATAPTLLQEVVRMAVPFAAP